MVTIHVVPLPKIRIHAPLTRLETGTTMPLLALGLDEHQAPSAYASATPPLLLEWSTSNKQVVSLPGVFVQVKFVFFMLYPPQFPLIFSPFVYVPLSLCFLSSSFFASSSLHLFILFSKPHSLNFSSIVCISDLLFL